MFLSAQAMRKDRGTRKALLLDEAWQLLKGGSMADFVETYARTCRKYGRSEEHTSELQSLMRISYAVFCLKKKTHHKSQPECHANHTRILTEHYKTLYKQTQHKT